MKGVPGVILGVALWGAATLSQAGGLTPELFVKAEIAAREVTLEGMQHRLNLLKAGKGVEEEMAAASVSETAVAQAFALYGTTANNHAAYGTQHSAEIEEWLAAHYQWQTRLSDLQKQFNDLSQAFDAIRGSKP